MRTLPALMRTVTALMLAACTWCLALDNTISNVPSPEQAPVVAEHETFDAVIRVKNPYDRAIKVTRVESSCPCATLELADYFLLPYQETTLTIAVTNENRSDLQRQLFRLELSDPQLPVIDINVLWTVTPNVAVDSVPETGPFDQRPTPARLRNIYAFTSNERPDELSRLREIIMLTSPASSAPEGGLQITEVVYDGTIWAFDQKAQGDNMILLIARAKDPEAKIPPGKYVEKVIVRTNHPNKPEFELTFYCAINPDAGKDGASDPWANMR